MIVMSYNEANEGQEWAEVGMQCPCCGSVHVGLPTVHGLCLDCYEHLNEVCGIHDQDIEAGYVVKFVDVA
jgi:hypothetical protein